MKSERCEAALRLGIPDLGRLDLSGELDIIDLTRMDTSPMQLTSDLPPFSRRADEDHDVDMDRKRVLVTDSNDGEQPIKRQRTDMRNDGMEQQQINADTSMSDVQPTMDVDDAGSAATIVTTSDTQPTEVPAAAMPAAWSQEENPSTMVGPSSEPVPHERPQPEEPMETKRVPASETERNASLAPTSTPSALPARPPPNRSQSAHQPRSASSPSSIEIPQAPQPTRTQSDHNLSLPSSSSAVQLPPPVVVKIKPAKELGLTHLPLMYENRNDKLYCRLCV